MSRSRALILLSGGLDSATCLAIARSEGFDCLALTFAYGQRHGREVEAAARVAAALGAAAHRVVTLPLGETVRSALTGSEAVPKADSVEAITADIPVTYVPARNTIFLAHALGLAESEAIRDLFIGVNAVDYSGYPDCRPDFIDGFEHLANLATREGVEGRPFRIHAPLIHLTKGEIIGRGLALGVDYGLTHSCYDPAPDGRACGHCDSCLLRRRGFAEAGLPDPVAYVEEEG